MRSIEINEKHRDIWHDSQKLKKSVKSSVKFEKSNDFWQKIGIYSIDFLFNVRYLSESAFVCSHCEYTMSFAPFTKSEISENEKIESQFTTYYVSIISLLYFIRCHCTEIKVLNIWYFTNSSKWNIGTVYGFGVYPHSIWFIVDQNREHIICRVFVSSKTKNEIKALHEICTENERERKRESISVDHWLYPLTVNPFCFDQTVLCDPYYLYRRSLDYFIHFLC